MFATAHPDPTYAYASLIQGVCSALAIAGRKCGVAWSRLVLVWYCLRIVALFAVLFARALTDVLAHRCFAALLRLMPQPTAQGRAFDILLCAMGMGLPMSRARQLLRILRRMPALGPPHPPP